MTIRTIRRLLVPVLLASSVGIVAVATSASAVVVHGITLQKGCVSPTAIGQPYECVYTLAQNVSGDTATITNVDDITAAKSGPVNSGPILPLLSLTLSGGAACNTGQSQCTIPDGGTITSAEYSYYTVQPADFTLPSSLLSDEVTATYTEVCTGPGSVNCPVGPQTATAGSSTVVTKAPSTTVTGVQLNGSTVTSVPLGSTVTDKATVSGTGAGTPTGTVTFTYFTNGTCSAPGSAAGAPTLNGSGVATSSSEGPITVIGNYSFTAVYGGDANYAGSNGGCEAFSVQKGTSSTVTTVQLSTGHGRRHGHKKVKAGPLVSFPAGSKVTDLATVTGTPPGPVTGTVTFTFFTNGTCAGSGSAAGAPSLSGGAATSNVEGPLAAGSYSFTAVYSGDSNYAGSNGGCEPFTVAAASCTIMVTIAPNPLVETGQSEVHAIVQVEACPTFAGDPVFIYSQQLVNSCEPGSVFFYSSASGTLSVPSPNSITVVLDDDGNATVELSATNCAPGSSVFEADLVKAPYYTATTTLMANPPVPTTAGVTGYPNPEVETGDTTSGPNGPSGNSDVYAVFYVEDNPVYAEAPVEISSAQLQNRCGLGALWSAGNGGTGSATGASTTLDDDGNAVFIFEGASCAAGDSTVIADVNAGTHDTFTTIYTISPPAPTI
ncbi:MAG TPA: Ig-like domain repeat protein [Acidimicrobiales bacterium]|nr:Ig-like domain repeat protein [Acidimicrobiales bacterium]